MGSNRTRGTKMLIPFLLALLVSQMVLSTASSARIPAGEFADRKNYYSSPVDPPLVLSPPPPHYALGPPRHSHHRTHGCPPPPKPSGGCGCGPAHGGSSGTSTPPSHGGGSGAYPPTIPINPPTTPTTPIVATPPSTPYIPPFTPTTPTTPAISTPPTPPSTPYIPPFTPTTPAIPSPPFVPVDPNTPLPGTCTFWGTNPTMIWGLFGYWATVGGLLGPVSVLPFGSSLSLQQALTNTRSDGYGALYREGTASLLNSMVMNKKFPFTTPEVRRSFVSALASEKVAGEQAKVFKMANEGKLKKQH